MTRTACTIAAALLVVLASATAAATRPLAPPTGDARGLRLLEGVHRAYVPVPAVTLTGQFAPSASFRFVVVLRSGIGVGEEFVARAPNGTTTLVGTRGSGTFARDPGRSCWRRVARSDSQSFENLGLRFPDQPKMRVKAPRRTTGVWLLPVVVGHDAGTFSIDGKTSLLRSITAATTGGRIVEHARTLRSAPRLPVAEPRC